MFLLSCAFLLTGLQDYKIEAGSIHYVCYIKTRKLNSAFK